MRRQLPIARESVMPSKSEDSETQRRGKGKGKGMGMSACIRFGQVIESGSLIETSFDGIFSLAC